MSVARATVSNHRSKDSLFQALVFLWFTLHSCVYLMKHDTSVKDTAMVLQKLNMGCWVSQAAPNYKPEKLIEGNWLKFTLRQMVNHTKQTTAKDKQQMNNEKWWQTKLCSEQLTTALSTYIQCLFGELSTWADKQCSLYLSLVPRPNPRGWGLGTRLLLSMLIPEQSTNHISFILRRGRPIVTK